jgi:hypothetical protein
MNSKYEQILETAIKEYNNAENKEQKIHSINMLHEVSIMCGKYNYSSKNMTEVYNILKAQ